MLEKRKKLKITNLTDSLALTILISNIAKIQRIPHSLWVKKKYRERENMEI